MPEKVTPSTIAEEDVVDAGKFRENILEFLELLADAVVERLPLIESRQAIDHPSASDLVSSAPDGNEPERGLR